MTYVASLAVQVAAIVVVVVIVFLLTRQGRREPNDQIEARFSQIQNSIADLRRETAGSLGRLLKQAEVLLTELKTRGTTSAQTGRAPAGADLKDGIPDIPVEPSRPSAVLETRLAEIDIALREQARVLRAIEDRLRSLLPQCTENAEHTENASTASDGSQATGDTEPG